MRLMQKPQLAAHIIKRQRLMSNQLFEFIEPCLQGLQCLQHVGHVICHYRLPPLV